MTDLPPTEPKRDAPAEPPPPVGSGGPPVVVRGPRPDAEKAPKPEKGDKGDSKPAPARARMPGWKKMLLAAASTLFVIGLALRFVGAASPGQPQGQPGTPPGTASALVEGGTGGEPGAETGEASGAAAWSPGLMALGLSFFVGFSVGTLLRAFVKIVLLFAGLFFLILTGLSYAELITVNWEAMDQIFETFGERIGSDFEHLRTIVTGALPQTGLGALGLFTGLKKR